MNIINTQTQRTMISFHYSSPTRRQDFKNPVSTFETPCKKRGWLTSRKTTDSGKEVISNFAERIHQLSPSLKPSLAQRQNEQNRTEATSPSKETKAPFTYLLNFTHNTLQSEIEKLKTILSQLCQQETSLKEEQKSNSIYYAELLDKLRKEQALIREKAGTLQEEIGMLEIEINEEQL